MKSDITSTARAVERVRRVMRVVNKGYTVAIQKGGRGAVDIPLSSVEGLYYKGITLRYVFRNNRVLSVYPIW